MLLLCLQTSAQSLSSLIPDSVAGPVTQAEMDRYDDYYPNFKIPLNNNKKDMTWDLSPFIHSLIYMYEINRDMKYIDYAIICCDRVQDARRTGDVDYVTQRIIPGWAYFTDQFTDSTWTEDLPAQGKRYISLDVSGLPEGIYVILIRTNNRMISEKFMKR